MIRTLLLTALLGTTLSTTSLGQDCADYSQGHYWISRVPSGEDRLYGVVSLGEYVYVAADRAGIRVISIADPHRPVVVRDIPVAGPVLDVQIIDGHLVAACWTAVKFFDLSTADLPDSISSVEATATRLTVDETRIFASAEEFGLSIIDASSTLTPSVIATYQELPRYDQVQVHGDLAVVASWNDGLYVFDITDLEAMTILDRYDARFMHGFVGLHFPTILISEDFNQFRTFTLSQDGLLTDRGATEIYSPGPVVVSDGYAYLSGGGGVAVLDLSTPGEPRQIASMNSSRVLALAATEEHVFAVRLDRGVDVFARGGADPPAAIASTEQPAAPHLWGSTAGHGTTLCKLRHFTDPPSIYFDVVDISDPAIPRLAESMIWPGYGVDVAMTPTHAYVADYSDGLTVVDISDPDDIAVFETVSLPGVIWDVETSGEYAYVASGAAGVRALSLDNPATPTTTAVWPSPYDCEAVAYAEDVVYAGLRDATIQVLDASDPNALIPKGSVQLNGVPTSIAVWGQTGVAQISDGRVYLIDFSNPLDPVVAKELRHSGQSRLNHASIRAGIAYATHLNGGLVAFDVTDPYAPRMIGAAGGRASGPVFTTANFVFADDGAQRTVIFPLQCDLSVPVAISGLRARNSPTGIELSWYALGAGHPTAFSVSAASAGRMWTLQATSGGAPDRFLAVDQIGPDVAEGSIQYELRHFDGASWIPVAETSFEFGERARTIRLDRIEPNPVIGGGTAIRFHLPSPSEIQLSIIDVSGRRVRTLTRSEFGRGGHSLHWDGSDDSGKLVASGVYYAALAVNGKFYSHRFALIR